MKKRISNRLRNRSPEHFVDLETFERTRRQIKRRERQRQAAVATTTTPVTSKKQQKNKIQSKRTKGEWSIASTKSQQKVEASGSKSNTPSNEQEIKEQAKQPASTMSAPKYRRMRSTNTSALLKDDAISAEYITSPECDFGGEEDSRKCETITANESQSEVSEERNLSKLVATKKRSRVGLEEPEGKKERSLFD